MGHDSVSMGDIKQFLQWGSKTPGHPENFKTAGIEVNTGPLGMVNSSAVGLAAAEVHLTAVYNKPGSLSDDSSFKLRPPATIPAMGDRERVADELHRARMAEIR